MKVDVLLSSRSAASTDSVAHNRVVGELLRNWDGISSRRDQLILVMGATNRPFDIDEGARRRFESRFLIPLPNDAARNIILRVNIHSH